MNLAEIEKRLDKLTSRSEILNLMYRYCEAIDLADCDALAELLGHARYGGDGFGTIQATPEFIREWYTHINRKFDGSPRTRHLTTNVILNIDASSDTASARSYYVVFQRTLQFPLQPIVAGRYHDQFERKDGKWGFSERYCFVDQIGDCSEHLVGVSLSTERYDVEPYDIHETLNELKRIAGGG